MRENIIKKTAFVTRLESDLSRSIIQILQHHAMEEITVSDLCEYANYPRSTFYKYYYDLEDFFSDCLLRDWNTVGFERQDDFYQMARRLFQYQHCRPECSSVFIANQNSIMFRNNFGKVLRRGVLQSHFMPIALRNSAFPSAQFIADYLLRSIELLGLYGDCMSESELRLTAVRLLHQPFARRAG